MKRNTADLAKARFFYELACQAFSQIAESSRRIDEKIQNTLALTATLAPILLGLFYYLFTANTGQLIGRSLLLFFTALGISSFSVAAVQGFRIYKPWPAKVLDPTLFRREFYKDDLLKIVRKSAGTIGDMTDKNRKVLWAKGLAYKKMLVLLVAGVLCFMAAFLVLAVSLVIN